MEENYYEGFLNKITKTKENSLIIIDFLNYSLNNWPLKKEQIENKIRKIMKQKENDEFFIEALRRIIVSRYYYYHLYNTMWLKNNFKNEYQQYNPKNNKKRRLSTHEVLINFLKFLSKNYEKEKTISHVLRKISQNLFRLKKHRNIADYELVRFFGIETFEDFLELHDKTIERWNKLFLMLKNN